jgi:hypothetical protein
MPRKKFIMIGIIFGSVAGGYAPTLFGGDSVCEWEIKTAV